MNDLTVSLVQTHLTWEDEAENLMRFSELFEQLPEETDVVVLPEMFTTGFTMRSPEVAVGMNGRPMHWMADQAAARNAVIMGSIVVEDRGQYYNRLVCAFPDGDLKTYDKRHLFRMADENEHFSGGTERLIIEHKGWRICPLVCYDLRFPVWSRNRLVEGRHDFDCLIYVANWPQARNSAWKTLIRARAHENQVYVVGVNRIGEDAKGIQYSGDSAIINPKGGELLQLEVGTERVDSATLSWQDLASYREKFPIGKDADQFSIHI